MFRGRLRLKTQQISEAINDYDTAISIFPNKGNAYLGKGDCYMIQGQF